MEKGVLDKWLQNQLGYHAFHALLCQEILHLDAVAVPHLVDKHILPDQIDLLPQRDLLLHVSNRLL